MAADASIPTLTEGTFLVVDDSPPNRKIVSALLTYNECPVIECTDGRIAKEIFLKNAQKIEGIISDLNMPGMDGIELLKVVREVSKTVPFFIITGDPDTDYVLESKKLGVQAVLVKPLRAKVIAEKMNLVFPDRFKVKGY
jgi:CheY-like chemotaxis protein